MRRFATASTLLSLIAAVTGCSSPPPNVTVSCCEQGHGGATAATPLVLAVTSDPVLGSLIYILKSDPPEEATLACYHSTGKGDLELVSARRVAWDLKGWNFGASRRGPAPEKLRDEVQKADEVRKRIEEERKAAEKSETEPPK